MKKFAICPRRKNGTLDVQTEVILHYVKGSLEEVIKKFRLKKIDRVVGKPGHDYLTPKGKIISLLPIKKVSSLIELEEDIL